MSKVRKTVIINAPVEKVFNYTENPNNLPEFWPSLVEVSDVKRLANGGTSNSWVYKMAGVSFKGNTETTEHVPNERWVYKTRGGIESTQTWLFQSEEGGTKVTFEGDYTVPIPLLGKLAEALIVKLNDREAETFLANLKDRMEA